jgi:flagellar biosynthesis GTPase FlhF
MDFQDFASKETSALLERLSAAAAAQAEDARTHARTEAQKIIDGVREELKERAAQLDARTAEKESLDAALKEARAEADAVRAKADAARAEADAARREIGYVRAEAEAARAETTTAQTATAAARAEADSARADVHKAHADADAARAEADSARADVTKLRSDLEAKLQASAATLDAARTSEQMWRHKLAEAEREIGVQRREADAAAQAAALREQMARAAPQPLDRLLTIFDQLAKAMTVGDVLTALVQGLATEFPRVAAFSVGANHLEGLHQVGFDFKNDISKVVIPMTMDSFLTQAATSGRVQGFMGRELEDSSRTPFGGKPAFVLTLPIAVRGETLAVVYADNGDQQPSGGAAQRGVKFAELLLWHAVPMLSKLSVDQEAINEVRNYATLLLTEIENMYDADASDDMDAENLRSRLKDNLDCAKRLYAQRVVSDGVAAAAPLLDEQLAAVIDAKMGTPFGRDLAAASRPAEPAARRNARKRA